MSLIFSRILWLRIASGFFSVSALGSFPQCTYSQGLTLSSRDVPGSPRTAVIPATWSSTIFFSSNNSQITEDGRKRLQELASSLENKELDVIIAIGHADVAEPAALALSKSRADSVKSFLMELGIEPRKIYTEGQGAKHNVAGNTPESRGRNRRVEIEAVGSKIAK